MRCPHCVGEIPDSSRFCGICGRKIDYPAAGGDGSGPLPDPRYMPAAGGSLFELPVSRGARIARIALVLALDAILLGAGIAMVISYLNARDHAGGVPARAPVSTIEVEIMTPGPALAVAPSAPPAVARATPRAKTRKNSKRTPVRPAKPAPATKPPLVPAGSAAVAAAVVGPTSALTAVETPTPAPTAAETAPATAAETPAAPTEQLDAGIAAPPSDADMEVYTRRVAVVIGRHKTELERCYRQAAKVATPAEPLQGRVVIQFQIMPDGKAVNARPQDNATGSDRLATCLVAQIEGWSFPDHGSPGPLEYRWPFAFKATK